MVNSDLSGKAASKQESQNESETDFKRYEKYMESTVAKGEFEKFVDLKLKFVLSRESLNSLHLAKPGVPTRLSPPSGDELVLSQKGHGSFC